MPARISTGTIVDAVSSLVAPWICGPSWLLLRRPRRNRTTKRINAPSTRTKITPVTIRITKYVWRIAFAFGDSGATGANPASAAAVAAAASASESAAGKARNRRDTTRAFHGGDRDDGAAASGGGERLRGVCQRGATARRGGLRPRGRHARLLA